MTTELNISCSDQVLNLTYQPVIASGGVNEDVVNFEFCSKWKDFTKTAVFFQDVKNTYRQILVNDSCVVPHEVIATPGILYIGVFGINGDVRRTSQLLKCKIVPGAISESTEVPDPTADVYTQIINLIEDNKFEGKSAYEVAVEMGFDGTVEEWLESLKGEDGHTPEKGVDYFTEEDKQEVAEIAAEYCQPFNGGTITDDLTISGGTFSQENRVLVGSTGENLIFRFRMEAGELTLERRPSDLSEPFKPLMRIAQMSSGYLAFLGCEGSMQINPQSGSLVLGNANQGTTIRGNETRVEGLMEVFETFTALNGVKIYENLELDGNLKVYGGNAVFQSPIILTQGVHYGATKPSNPVEGRLFLVPV